MENKGLLFIPDISGFTRFVNETEIGHSRMIIQELLELIINANDIGLEVSEIEGDAISVVTDECDPENLKPVNIAEIIEVAGQADKKLSAVFVEVIGGLI